MSSAPVNLPETQRVVKWYPPSYDIRVEDALVPRIEEPDDAIVKIKLAGLCGSDLHVYRGHEDVDGPCVCGHEFVGEIVALGTAFTANRVDNDRPALYSELHIGDRVVSPFTVSCGECHFCRIGATCRCVHSALFGTPTLPGGQAQYIRVPKAGGTLVRVGSVFPQNGTGLDQIANSALLLLGDILPTGAFAALQALQHPKILPILTNKPYPALNPGIHESTTGLSLQSASLNEDDRLLTVAIIGLGPVGLCATVSLLHMLFKNATRYRVIAIDLLSTRREKMQAIYDTMANVGGSNSEFRVASPDETQDVVKNWTGGIGCNAVLEVVGHPSALTLAYELVRPFGVISSVGVHQSPPLPLTGRDVYNKNVTFEFGRCPVRALLPLAIEILQAQRDVFNGVGTSGATLVERIVSIEEATHWYKEFNEGKCGKVLFDPWL